MTHKVDPAQLLKDVKGQAEDRPPAHARPPDIHHRLELRLLGALLCRRNGEQLAPLLGVVRGDKLVDDALGLFEAALREKPPRRIGQEKASDGEEDGRDRLENEGEAPSEAVGNVDRSVGHKKTGGDCQRRRG